MSRDYRADHVGSFLRPPELLHAVGEHAEGRIGDEELRAAQDAAILQALDLQREVGLEIFSDGEYRRSWFAGAWAASVGGLVEAPPAQAPPAGRPTQWRGPGAEAATQTLMEVLEGPSVVGERIFAARRMAGDECAFLAEHAPGPFKITFTSAAGQFNFWWREGITDQVYSSRGELLDDMVGILRDEVANVVAEGASYVQLDSLGYVIQLADNSNTRAFVEAGGDHNAALEQMIAADNAALAPAIQADGVVVGLHMCRGNNRSSWVSEGTYEPIAERAFAELNVDRFLLEYDTERAGGFEPLRFVPAPKIVVLGIVSSKEAGLESQDSLLRRIDEASQYVPVERLALSPQCGFASTAKGNLLSWDDQRRKLELVVDTARKVWG
jgi:5-methyltetrahydropteroyltriglutamate--homocysteine methyltransferase